LSPGKHNSSVISTPSVVGTLKGAAKRPMPSVIHPMLALSIEKPFDNPEWLFEIKWDGYRAVSFIQDGEARLVSRNQNELTAAYPELSNLPETVRAKTAILDGEVVALDGQGRSSFGLMQQRTGIREGGRRKAGRDDIPVVYYAFDLLYLDGYDLRRVSLEQRKQALADILTTNELIRYSNHFEGGIRLFDAAKQNGLEGIVAKRRSSCYEEKRSREWLKIKITQTVDCVIGAYTEPEGSRQYFGALVLGLYNKEGKLIHVGQAGTGFDFLMLKQIWQSLQQIKTERNPFHGPVVAKHVHWVKPELVAEIKYTEWTHESSEGGYKLRAPVFMGLRKDKKPEECTFEEQIPRKVLDPEEA
jgi:bifunctional non-homologous end joining protein LigD